MDATEIELRKRSSLVGMPQFVCNGCPVNDHICSHFRYDKNDIRSGRCGLTDDERVQLAITMELKKNEIPYGLIQDSHTAWWQNEVRVRDEILKLSTCTCHQCGKQVKASEIARIRRGSPVCWHCADYLDNLADEGRPR